MNDANIYSRLNLWMVRALHMGVVKAQNGISYHGLHDELGKDILCFVYRTKEFKESENQDAIQEGRACLRE